MESSATPASKVAQFTQKLSASPQSLLKDHSLQVVRHIYILHGYGYEIRVTVGMISAKKHVRRHHRSQRNVMHSSTTCA